MSQKGRIFMIAVYVCWIEKFMRTFSIFSRNREKIVKQEEDYRKKFEDIVEGKNQQTSKDNAGDTVKEAYDRFWQYSKDNATRSFDQYIK